MNRIRPYFSTLRLRTLLELQYRSAALWGMLTQIFFGLIMIFRYQALYASGGSQSTTLAQTVTYVWLQQAFFRLIVGSDGELSQQIRTGDLGYSLCRPIDLYTYWYMRTLANQVVGSLMRAIPMLMVAFLIPQPWGIMAPASPAALGAFGLSLFLGMLSIGAPFGILQAINILTLDPKGAANVLNFLNIFLAGNLLPLTLFPDAWQRALMATPFAQTLDVPIRFYTGQLPVSALASTAAMQLFWIAAMILIGRNLWKYSLNRTVIQGG
jgi:ABC-2 type transport system permease protein